MLVPIATRKKIPPKRPMPDRGFGVLDLSVVITNSSTAASQSGWRFRRVSITPLVLFHTFIRRKFVPRESKPVSKEAHVDATVVF